MSIEWDVLRAAYLNDGAIVVRDVVPQCWVQRMRRAVDRAIDAPSRSAINYTAKGRPGRYVGDFFMWTRDADFSAFALDSPLPMIAGRLMGCNDLTLFFDHLLVKEPLTTEPTPWHQDLSYWPLSGSDIITLWVPLDPVSPDTGAVAYLRGSHRSGALYAPVPFSAESDLAATYRSAGLEPPPDLSAVPPSELLSWTTEPGDVVVHHPRTLHFAPGNASASRRRRAIALRYLGRDAVYHPRPGNFLEKPEIRALLPTALTYAAGDRLAPPSFPAAGSRRQKEVHSC